MMKTSDSITKIAASLVAMQAEAKHANFDSKNPHFKSKYASLSEVIDTVRPVLAKHGLAVIQLPAFRTDIGHVLCTRIVHESGEWIEDEMRLNPIKDDPQGLGSSITYAKRYSLPGVCLIASEDDDDANAASHPPTVNNAQARVVSLEVVTKEINACTTEKQVRDAFPRWNASVGGLKGSDAYQTLTDQCTKRIAELKAANEPVAA
jgi:hypothetical protein